MRLTNGTGCEVHFNPTNRKRSHRQRVRGPNLQVHPERNMGRPSKQFQTSNYVYFRFSFHDETTTDPLC